jgi:hypothetical protein
MGGERRLTPFSTDGHSSIRRQSGSSMVSRQANAPHLGATEFVVGATGARGTGARLWEHWGPVQPIGACGEEAASTATSAAIDL